MNIDLEEDDMLQDYIKQSKQYERDIKEADNKKLKSYFIEFSKQVDDPKLVQGGYEFLEWIIENK